MRHSLFTNLIISTALTIIVGMLGVFGSWAFISHFHPRWLRDGDLRGMASHVAEAVSFDSDDRPSGVHLPRNLQQVFAALPMDVMYQVLGPNGEVLLSSSSPPVSLIPSGTQPTQTLGISAQSHMGQDYEVIVVPLTHPKFTSYLVIGRSDRFDEMLGVNEASNVQSAALVVSASTMTAFAIVVLVTIGRLLRRLESISGAASQIDPLNLRARLAVEGMPREITPLLESFNQALERLEAGFRIQQDFLATAAHELKTPLALIRGEIELDGPTNRKAILSDLDHMSRQVHQLLHLAEVSDANNLTLALTDVTPVVQDAIGFLNRLAQASGIELQFDHPPTAVVVDADASALFVLVRNLVENAINHAPPGSIVEIVVDANGLAVIDHGDGIPESDIPMLFKRFWRGAHRRDEGAGLGLSICSEVARGHGWTLAARNIEQAGAEFRLSFEGTSAQMRA